MTPRSAGAVSERGASEAVGYTFLPRSYGRLESTRTLNHPSIECGDVRAEASQAASTATSKATWDRIFYLDSICGASRPIIALDSEVIGPWGGSHASH